MFITKKHMPRRTFLKAAGVTVALPLMESMLPAQTPIGETAANPLPRFVGLWHPMGASPGYWSPTTEGKNFEFSYITKPLEPYRKYVTLISGLDATSSNSTPQEPGGDHARSAAFLSGARPRPVEIYLGTTVDQHIAGKIGQDSLLPSVQLGIQDAGANTGVCNWGYHCAYTNSISWSSPTQPLPTQINPRVVFERMFGDGRTPEERLRSRQQDGSILDSVTREIAFVKREVGPTDRQRLDSYLEDVREIERRLQNVANAQVDMSDLTVPFGVPESHDEHIKLMYDLIALGFQGEITRVASLMIGRDSSSPTFPLSGYDGPWHSTSHHSDAAQNKLNYAKINRYHVQGLAYLVEKMQNTPDGDGSLLDHVLIYKGSNMGNSHRHAHEKCPTILVGGASGRLEGGRHLVFRDNTQRTSNLLLSLANLYGVQMDSIGDSADGGGYSTEPLSI